jgi:hypothetical protein
MTITNPRGRKTPGTKNSRTANVTPGETPARQLNRSRKRRASPVHASLKKRRAGNTKKNIRASETMIGDDVSSSDDDKDIREENNNDEIDDEGKNDHDDDDYYDENSNHNEKARDKDGEQLDFDDYVTMEKDIGNLNNRIAMLKKVVEDKSRIIASNEKLMKELHIQLNEQGDELRSERMEKKKLFNSTTIESNEIMYDRVATYVRRHMFKKVKFTHDKALDSVGKGTMGYAVAEAFSVPRDQLIPWWQTYKQAAHAGIAQTRNGKITELKKAFISK